MTFVLLWHVALVADENWGLCFNQLVCTMAGVCSIKPKTFTDGRGLLAYSFR